MKQYKALWVKLNLRKKEQEGRDKEKAQQIKDLRKLLKRCNNKVFGIVKSVSSSGMSRNIDFYAFECVKGEVKKHWLSYRIAGLLDYSFNDNKESVKVSGCGMDMIFSVVYNLGSCLYPKGDGKTITGRNGSKEAETDGGYLLTSEYL